MKNTAFPKPLCGIIPPMITPLKDRDTLDTGGLEKLIEHIISGGVHGIFILGTTGEAPSLSYKLRQELVERTCAQVKKRVPVLVGITDTSFVESSRLAQAADKAGADALVVAPPHYFPAGQPELLEYLKHLVKKLALPLFLYNMPSLTKLIFEPETVQKAAELKAIIGLKDSSANMVYFHKLQMLLAGRPDFSLLVGPEELLAETILLGGHGGICGGANLFPELYVDLYNSACNGDLGNTIKLHAKVMTISREVYGVGHHWSSYLKGLKCALSCLGICNDFMSEPFHRFRKEERKLLQTRLKKLGILKKKTK